MSLNRILVYSYFGQNMNIEYINNLTLHNSSCVECRIRPNGSRKKCNKLSQNELLLRFLDQYNSELNSLKLIQMFYNNYTHKFIT